MEDSFRTQIHHILESDAFCNAESLRRLLSYLSGKSLAGEADQLKEYTIGIDAFGKPSSYDPRHDSIVRLQVGRLRQRLTEYYQSEGREDPIRVEIPKGRFKLNFEPRRVDTASDRRPVGQSSAILTWRTAAIVLASLLVLTIGVATYLEIRPRVNNYETQEARLWTAELQVLWAPFVATNRPLIVSMGAPPFLRFGDSFLMLRDSTVNRPEDIDRSPNIAAIRKALRNADVHFNYHYVPFGEVNLAFRLGKLLAFAI